MLIDDWAPGREDWFDAESDTWHYEPGEGERFPGLEEAALGDHVQQVLSDATGADHAIWALRLSPCQAFFDFMAILPNAL